MTLRSLFLNYSVIAATFASLAAGCSSDDDSAAPAQACTPGVQQACDCPGGDIGVQVCSDDGSKFETCDCSGGGGSAGMSGSGGDSGSGGSQTAGTGGSGGSSGTAGASGSGGTGATSGTGGSSGTAGSGGSGATGGTGGMSGTAGMGGTAGVGGSGATGGGGTAGMSGTGGTGGSDPCAGAVTYAGELMNAGPVWAQLPQSQGQTGLDAGNTACQSIGADHVCDYEELLVSDTKGEFANVPQGTSFWVQRTTAVMVNGVLSQPGPGGNCNNWNYSTNHIGDGEYATFDQTGVITYHLDNDTFYDGVDPTHAIPGDLQCGGVIRSIPCCFAVCNP